ncbi:hypothetical protein [Nocardia crassostreae]|uniref:hypothetical protein n=1 Tax=Nocardia crassostreae TaxID=53428 RepID=UPI000AA435BB|nr:hypothetical protein [Nocardia crassostreae]
MRGLEKAGDDMFESLRAVFRGKVKIPTSLTTDTTCNTFDCVDGGGTVETDEEGALWCRGGVHGDKEVL